VQDIRALFADYASYHQTKGNKAFHRLGIPLIVLTAFGMLARVTLLRAGGVRIDAAMLLVAIAEVVYLILEWRLALAMLLISAALYLGGAAIPLSVNAGLFILGWIFQFIGHSVYEHRQPAFLKNGMHLLVGPLWILNDLLPVVKTRSEA